MLWAGDEPSLNERNSEAGTSFRDVLAATRERPARHYLSTTGHAPVEVTILLGYSEVATFSRAFRKWGLSQVDRHLTGCLRGPGGPPSPCRRRLTRQLAATP